MLFLVVIMRAQVDLGRALLADMAVRPEAILPHSLARSLLLEMERSPILHALFTRDTEVLGTVVDTAADDHTSLLRERTKSRVLDRQRQSRLLADSVRRTLEEPHSEQELHSAWPKITALIDHLVGRAHAALNHYRTTRRD